MALDENFYRLTLIGGKELILTDNAKNTVKLLSKISEGILDSGYIGFSRIKVGNEPIYFRKSSISTVERINKEAIGAMDKIWRITQ